MPGFAHRQPLLRDRRVLVAGLGKSGLAATRLLAREHAQIVASDVRSEEQLGAAAAEARALGAELQVGRHPTAELATAVDLIVLSPGVPASLEWLRAARDAGVPVWGEIELAARFCRGRVVGITGSNGKSTVTSMVGGILRGAGLRGGTGGNLDTPFTDLLAEDGAQAVHAVELSSFQLETVETLKPAVAVLLNLSPDHLDRYPSYEDYARAKARLLDLQSAQDFSVLNNDDSESRRFDGHVRGRLFGFSTTRELERGAFLHDGVLTLRTAAGDEPLLAAADLTVRGEHNVANALAAALACRLIGCAGQAIAEGLRAYRALPHRLEHVRTLRGVAYYNDSKATNPASTARALGAFAPGTVHLILGGRDKGADWSELLPLIRRHCARVLLIGESADRLSRILAGTVPLVRTETLAAAVAAGFAEASDGQVVLLAPACASFDQFKNFEERGQVFRREVEALHG